jgi:hypothetical protein
MEQLEADEIDLCSETPGQNVNAALIGAGTNLKSTRSVNFSLRTLEKESTS